jgi:hypothetical protein
MVQEHGGLIVSEMHTVVQGIQGCENDGGRIGRQKITALAALAPVCHCCHFPLQTCLTVMHCTCV